MSPPSRAQMWAMEAQIQHDQAVSAANADAAEADARRRRDWLALVTGAGASGGVLSLKQWTFEEASIGPTGAWRFERTDLDLSGAVALTMTVSGEPPQAESHGTEGTVWKLHRELTLRVFAQDSLDGKSWHSLGSAGINTTNKSAVLRVIDALGAHCQIALWVTPVIAKKRNDDGSIQSRDGDFTLTRDPTKSAQRIRNLKIIVAARSL